MERKKPRISSKREHPIEVILLRVNLGHADFVAGYKEWCVWTIFSGFHFDQTFSA